MFFSLRSIIAHWLTEVPDKKSQKSGRTTGSDAVAHLWNRVYHKGNILYLAIGTQLLCLDVSQLLAWLDHVGSGNSRYS